MIVKCCKEYNIESLCHCNSVTSADFYEFIDDLALRGFKDKYNQHNHPENNKENNMTYEEVSNKIGSIIREWKEISQGKGDRGFDDGPFHDYHCPYSEGDLC